MSRPIKQLLVLGVWLGVTAGVAFLIARNTESVDSATLPGDLAPIGQVTRSTVGPTAHLIASAISFDARAIQGMADEARASLANSPYEYPQSHTSRQNIGPTSYC